MLEYYELLRAVLRRCPHLLASRTRCRHCGIFFLVDPRNKGRKDLGCPFGCREAHRKESSTRRSLEYYQTAEGKYKKQLQNDKRKAKSATGRVVEPAVEASAKAAETVKDPERRETAAGFQIKQEGIDWPSALLEYLRMVTSLIEARKVSLVETLELLRGILRQHSIARQRRIEHIVSHLHQHPP